MDVELPRFFSNGGGSSGSGSAAGDVRIKTLANYNYKGTKTLDGARYYLWIRWNENTGKFYMDLKGLNNDVDLTGLALLPGKNLLEPFGYDGQLGELWIIDHTHSDTPHNPEFDDMGTRWTLEYTPRD